MKFDVEDDFVADYRQLTNEERALFRQVIRQINEAYAQRGHQPLPRWPASLKEPHTAFSTPRVSSGLMREQCTE